MKTIPIDRREFLEAVGLGAMAAAMRTKAFAAQRPGGTKPNLLFVFADQWRAQATGYAGNTDVHTPNLDRLAARSVNFTHAVSGCPVCCPYRASLMTGRYPLTHGVFMNDVQLNTDATSFAQALNEAGYHTGYIGKWHIDARGRSSFTPPGRRQGFAFWKALECTHNYNRSAYYAGESDTKLFWDGYDAVAQTREAQRYIRSRAGRQPFALFLSWGPPHAPYHTAPNKHRRLVAGRPVTLRPNVPASRAAAAKKDIAGYYAHIAALDECIGELLATLKETGVEKDTVFVFTSDHGDMLYSHGQRKKQRPWDESIRVPLLVRHPAGLGDPARAVDMPINTPDLMPTVLGLCGITPPKTVEGTDYSGVVTGKTAPSDKAVLITCVQPFGQWTRQQGGREYRGVRTRRYTYVRDLKGPWLLFDNKTDPYQRKNLVNEPSHAALRKELDAMLQEKLKETNDEFRPGPYYLRKWGYKVDKTGTVPYRR